MLTISQFIGLPILILLLLKVTAFRQVTKLNSSGNRLSDLYLVKFTHLYENSNRVYHKHNPVLLKESLNYLITDANGLYLDVTLGYGGHTEAILSILEPKGRVVAIDRDPEAIYHISKRLGQYVESGRLSLEVCKFSNLIHLFKSKDLPISGYTGIIADLGVSTHQLEDSRRGFSYLNDGPLDMRMGSPLNDPYSNERFRDIEYSLETSNSAYRLVNKASQETLASIFKNFGEERHCNMIARRIVEDREKFGDIKSTLQLCESIGSVIVGDEKSKVKTLSRIFQAIRVYVNDEFYELEEFLSYAPNILKAKGRIVTISYHSLEDRMVKKRFNQLKNATSPKEGLKAFKILTKKCVTASTYEVERNKRSRSAKLRCIERLDAN